jgi:hypothetical protein
LIRHLLERQRANFGDSLLELGNREGRRGVEPLWFGTEACREQSGENRDGDPPEIICRAGARIVFPWSPTGTPVGRNPE